MILESLLPGGEPERASEQPIFEKVQPSLLLPHCILAVIQADMNDTQENIRDASVIGFLYVTEVDATKKKFKVLAPLSGRLPNKAMIWGAWPATAGDLVG